jgi:hypothetical protein
MKTDLTRGSRGDPEREALRSMLRDWQVPGPPADLEQDLRRAFRQRRRPSRPRVLWLALAAGLTLVVLSRVVPTRQTVPSASPKGPGALIASPLPAPAAPPVSVGSVVRAPDVAVAATHAPRARRAPDSSPGDHDVIVEPGQAELLAQLGRRLGDVRQAMPGTAIPRVETLAAGAAELEVQDVRVGGLLPHRSQWETVASEWPSTATPGIWR